MSTIVTHPETEVRDTSTIAAENCVRNKNLKFVDNLANYKVHENDVDIRDFTVKLSTGEVIGEVEGLLADVSAELVRYVEIEVEDDIVNRYTADLYDADDKNLLMPIGLISIDADSKTVTLNGIGVEHMINYPRFNRKSGYTTNYEIETNNFLSDFHDFGNTYNRSMFDTDRYRQSDTFDQSFYASKFYVG